MEGLISEKTAVSVSITKLAFLWTFAMILQYYDTAMVENSLLLKINLEQLYHIHQFIFLSWYRIVFYKLLSTVKIFWKKRICGNNWNSTAFLYFIIHNRAETNRRLTLPEDFSFLFSNNYERSQMITNHLATASFSEYVHPFQFLSPPPQNLQQGIWNILWPLSSWLV